MDTLLEEAMLSVFMCTIQGNNLLHVGVNAFLLELNIFQTDLGMLQS